MALAPSPTLIVPVAVLMMVLLLAAKIPVVDAVLAWMVPLFTIVLKSVSMMALNDPATCVMVPVLVMVFWLPPEIAAPFTAVSSRLFVIVLLLPASMPSPPLMALIVPLLVTLLVLLMLIDANPLSFTVA